MTETILIYLPVIAGFIGNILLLNGLGLKGKLAGLIIPSVIIMLAIRFRASGIPIEMMKGAALGALVSIMIWSYRFTKKHS